MSVYIYRSTDNSAPQLSGTIGSLIPVLDACLVNGYDSKTPMGQTKPFSGTNIAVYRMNGGSQSYLAVDDGFAQYARIRGFTQCFGAWSSTMPDSRVVGNHPFPNDYQMAGGDYIHKSTAASSATRGQTIVSDGTTMYMMIDGDAGGSLRVWTFGDIHSYNLYDPNPCMIIGVGAGATYPNYFPRFFNLQVQADHYLAMRFDGNGYSIPMGKYPISGAHSQSNSYCMGQSGQFFMYPDPILGGVILSPVGVVEQGVNNNYARGRMPGLQAPCHSYPFSTGDTMAGAAGTPLEGKTFEAFMGKTYDNGWTGCFLLETSDTWRTTNFR